MPGSIDAGPGLGVVFQGAAWTVGLYHVPLKPGLPYRPGRSVSSPTWGDSWLQQEALPWAMLPLMHF